MNKTKNSKFGENSAQNSIDWQKIQADGKWLWIFKRGASWATIILFLYGLGALTYPSFFNFQPSQFLILSGMFVGFLVSSIAEWSKMEELNQESEIN